MDKEYILNNVSLLTEEQLAKAVFDGDVTIAELRSETEGAFGPLLKAHVERLVKEMEERGPEAVLGSRQVAPVEGQPSNKPVHDSQPGADSLGADKTPEAAHPEGASNPFASFEFGPEPEPEKQQPAEQEGSAALSTADQQQEPLSQERQQPASSTEGVQNAHPAGSQPDITAIESIFHIEVNRECRVLKFGKEVLLAKPGEDNVLLLRKGKHKLQFVTDQETIEKVQVVEDFGTEDFIEVKFSLQQVPPVSNSQEAKEEQSEVKEPEESAFKATAEGDMEKEYGDITGYESSSGCGYSPSLIIVVILIVLLLMLLDSLLL